MNDIKSELMGRLRQNVCSSEKVTSNRKHPKGILRHGIAQKMSLLLHEDLHHINHYASTTLSSSIFFPAYDPNKDGSQIHISYSEEIRYRG
jgi:hypothetical protein